MPCGWVDDYMTLAIHYRLQCFNTSGPKAYSPLRVSHPNNLYLYDVKRSETNLYRDEDC